MLPGGLSRMRNIRSGMLLALKGQTKLYAHLSNNA